MYRHQVRTGAFLIAGGLFLSQFLISLYEDPFLPGDLPLIVAAVICVGLGILRLRAPPPETPRTGFGVVEWALLVLVGFLAIVTVGLAGLVLF